MGTKSKPRLGRGLSGLISEPVEVPARGGAPAQQSPTEDQEIPSTGQPASEGRLLEIDPELVSANPFQPRTNFDPASLEDLAQSIRQSGVIQPIAIRRVGEQWQLVAGERRLRAAKLAGLRRIPALFVEASDEQAAEWAIVENVQRKDLDPIEQAEALRALLDRFGLTQGEVAERVGMDRSSVANTLRLLELEPDIQRLISGGKLSPGHGKALLALPSGPERIGAARSAAEDGWSVRHTERWCQEHARDQSDRASIGPSSGEKRAPSHADLERQLGEHLGTRVSIRTNAEGSKGKVAIEFFTLEQFDGIMRRLGFEMRS